MKEQRKEKKPKSQKIEKIITITLDILVIGLLIFYFVWNNGLAPKYDITVKTDCIGNIQEIIGLPPLENNKTYNLTILQQKIKEQINKTR